MSKDPAKVAVVQSIEKAPDLQCHIRIVEVEGARVVEFRDFIPSLKEYGRGYWFPLNAESVFSIINGLTDVARVESV